MNSSFHEFADGTEEVETENGADRLCIVVKNQIQTALAINYLRAECSFRQADRVILSTNSAPDSLQMTVSMTAR